jgi:alpha-methylacyl-CoA racemase
MLTGGYAGYQVYLCADGKMISFGPLEPHFFATFCEAVGEAVEATDRARIAEIFATRTRSEWMERLPRACVAEVLELPEVLEHPQHVARGMFETDAYGLLIKPPVGEIVRGKPPKHGADTDEVLAAAGVDVAAARAAGAIR